MLPPAKLTMRNVGKTRGREIISPRCCKFAIMSPANLNGSRKPQLFRIYGAGNRLRQSTANYFSHRALAAVALRLSTT
jgi:hypothetical protein